MEILIKPIDNKTVQTYVDNVAIGDPLNNNSYKEDGFRYHDIIHFTILEKLNWSPVIYNNLFKKGYDIKKPFKRSRIKEEVVSYLIFMCYKNPKFIDNTINQISFILKQENLDFDNKIIHQLINTTIKRLKKVVINKPYRFKIEHEKW